MQQQQHFPSPFPRSCISLSLPQQAAPHRIDSHDCLVCNVQQLFLILTTMLKTMMLERARLTPAQR
jgi:hypothetical protein